MIISNCIKVIITNMGRDRYNELGTSALEITLKENEKITEYFLIKNISDYYQEILTQEELKNIAYKTDDCFGYNKIAEKALLNNYKLKRYEIMGGKVFFEGLTPEKIEKGIAYYRIYIGS